jgi:hypothetical protein
VTLAIGTLFDGEGSADLTGSGVCDGVGEGTTDGTGSGVGEGAGSGVGDGSGGGLGIGSTEDICWKVQKEPSWWNQSSGSFQGSSRLDLT